MSETFKRRIITIGNSKGLTIPSFLIKEKRINPNKEYSITIKETKQKK